MSFREVCDLVEDIWQICSLSKGFKKTQKKMSVLEELLHAGQQMRYELKGEFNMQGGAEAWDLALAKLERKPDKVVMITRKQFDSARSNLLQREVSPEWWDALAKELGLGEE